MLPQSIASLIFTVIEKVVVATGAEALQRETVFAVTDSDE